MPPPQNNFRLFRAVGAAAMAGMGYLMKDKRTYQRLARKGKKMVVKAEEAIDDIIDDMMP